MRTAPRRALHTGAHRPPLRAVGVPSGACRGKRQAAAPGCCASMHAARWGACLAAWVGEGAWRASRPHPTPLPLESSIACPPEPTHSARVQGFAPSPPPAFHSPPPRSRTHPPTPAPTTPPPPPAQAAAATAPRTHARTQHGCAGSGHRPGHDVFLRGALCEQRRPRGNPCQRAGERGGGGGGRAARHRRTLWARAPPGLSTLRRATAPRHLTWPSPTPSVSSAMPPRTRRARRAGGRAGGGTGTTCRPALRACPSASPHTHIPHPLPPPPPGGAQPSQHRV